jgi:hypothetical protein
MRVQAQADVAAEQMWEKKVQAIADTDFETAAKYRPFKRTLRNSS